MWLNNLKGNKDQYVTEEECDKVWFNSIKCSKKIKCDNDEYDTGNNTTVDCVIVVLTSIQQIFSYMISFMARTS